MEFRLAKKSDAKRLLEIYKPYVEKTAITFEYEVPTIAEFEKRIEKIGSRYPYIVAIENNRLIGCGALHFVWDRLAEIRSLAVDPERKTSGIGRNIVHLLEKEGIERGVKMFFTLTYQPGFFAKCDYIETAKEKLPQKVWKECVYCPQYPYCNEIAFVKTTVDYEPGDIMF